MALGILAIIFTVMVVVSGLGITFLFLAKNQQLKTGLFYFLAIWGMGISYMNATRLPSNFLGQQLIAWAFGFLAVAGIIIKITKPEKSSLAEILVTIGIVSSIVHLLLF